MNVVICLNNDFKRIPERLYKTEFDSMIAKFNTVYFTQPNTYLETKRFLRNSDQVTVSLTKGWLKVVSHDVEILFKGKGQIDSEFLQVIRRLQEKILLAQIVSSKGFDLTELSMEKEEESFKKFLLGKDNAYLQGLNSSLQEKVKQYCQ